MLLLDCISLQSALNKCLLLSGLHLLMLPKEAGFVSFLRDCVPSLAALIGRRVSSEDSSCLLQLLSLSITPSPTSAIEEGMGEGWGWSEVLMMVERDGQTAPESLMS